MASKTENSRLIVKNLPKHLTDERFRAHFSRNGQFEITDCKIVKSKNNEKVSRRFGFVGFKTPEQAAKALKFFNNTFVDTSRITVEYAVPYGDPNTPRAWSKYTKGTSAYKRQEEIKQRLGKGKKGKGKSSDDDDEKSDSVSKKNKASSEIDEIFDSKGKKRPREEDNEEDAPNPKQAKLDDETEAKKKRKEQLDKEKFEEFMGLVGKKQKLWANEDIKENGKSKKGGKSAKSDEEMEDEDSESSSLYEDLPSKATAPENDDDNDDDDDMDVDEGEDKDGDDEEGEDHALAKDENVSDLDYLRSKISKSLPSKIEKLTKDSKKKKSDSNSDSGSDSGSDSESGEENSSENEDESDNDEDENEDVDDSDDEDSSSSDSDSDDSEEARRKQVTSTLFVPDIADSGRLFVRNLPFNVTEADIRSLFSPFGDLSEVHITRDKKTGQGKGIAFVRYAIPSDAIKAHQKLDATIFQGRLLHVLPAKLTREELKAKAGITNTAVDDSKGMKSEYQREKEAKKRAQAMTETHAWNPLYIRADAVMSAMAEKYDVEKSELLNPENAGLGLRQALAETSIVNETKRYLTEHGISLTALEGIYQGKITRSDNIIFVKNIPAMTEAIELRALFGKYGKLGRVILPPTKTMAMIEFVSASDAKAAFKGLAYREFHDAPLFLEFAPVDVFLPEHREIPTEITEETSKGGPTIMDSLRQEEIDAAEHTNETTIYVKNLNFETTEARLEKLFKKCGEIRNVTIAKKRDMKNEGNLLSMGYGFVEFKTREAALEAFKLLQGKVLDGHALELQLGKSGSKAATANRKETKRKAASTKLMVKNVPFQANKKEIRELFAAFGELKSVRLPLKQGGKGHRGFAFVEFLTKEEAANAMEALANTHLYGRHLVIDYGEDTKGLGADEGKE